MNYITFSNGVKIPQLGLGVFKTPSGAATVDAVRWALEAGYRHIDTAKIYGNEESVGVGMKESSVPREEIFLTTKLWNEDIRRGRTREAFEESLARLGTDYLDLYLIHWPADGYEKAWGEMEKLYEEGKIRAIGVSNFHEHHLESLMKTARIRPMTDQIESHPYFTNQPLISRLQESGMPVQVWSPLGGTGKSILADESLAMLAEKYGKSPAQVVIRWHIQRGVIVIPKSTHKERIEANIDVFDFELSQEDMALIDGLNRNIRSGSNPDTFNF